MMIRQRNIEKRRIEVQQSGTLRPCVGLVSVVQQATILQVGQVRRGHVRASSLAHFARSGVRRTHGTIAAVDVPVRPQDGLAAAPFAAHVAASDALGPEVRAADARVLAGHHGPVLGVHVADQRRDVAHVQAADTAHGGPGLGMRTAHVPAERAAVAGKAAAQLARVHALGRGRGGCVVFNVRRVHGHRGEPSAAARERAVQRLRVAVRGACVSPQVRQVRAERPAPLAHLARDGQVPGRSVRTRLQLADRPIRTVKRLWIIL